MLRIWMVRHKDAFSLSLDEAGASYKVKILDIKLYASKAKLSVSVFVKHAKALELGNAKYPVRRVVCKTFTVPRGNSTLVRRIYFSVNNLRILWCVDNGKFKDSYAKSPYNFKHCDLTQLKLYLDGQQQHIKPLEPNFSTHQYIVSLCLVYESLLGNR